MVRMLRNRGIRPVLAVDADPNSTLGPLLGLSPAARLGDIREGMMEEKEKVTGIPKERLLDQRVQECVAEGLGFDLLTMGRSEGPDCYCYVNNLLRQALSSLKENYKAVVVDNEAGMEHISRMNLSEVDCLALVSEPTAVSARSVRRIMELAASLPIKVRRRVLVWNKVASSGVPDSVAKLTAVSMFDAVVKLPFDERIAAMAVEEASVMDSDLPEGFDGLMDACIMGVRS